jgi:hypothetical protein
MQVDYVDDTNDGPIIRFYGTKSDEFRALLNSTLALASGALMRLPISSALGLNFSGSIEVYLVCEQMNRGVIDNGDNTFDWILESGRWSDVAAFIEPLCQEDRGERYQWVTGAEARRGLDIGNISVLVSHSEYGNW